MREALALTKGFRLEWDGVEIASRTWSWVGLGELHATVELDGKPVEVRVALTWGGLKELDGQCAITVGDQELTVRHLK